MAVLWDLMDLKSDNKPFECDHGEGGACSGQWVLGPGPGGYAGRAGSLQVRRGET